MPDYILLIVYLALIVVASLIGGWLPTVVRFTHVFMQEMISFVGGLMLGIGIFHLLPHAVGEHVSIDRAVWWMMAGLMTMFFMLRVFHFHQHAPAEQIQPERGEPGLPLAIENPFASPPSTAVVSPHEEGHRHEHDQAHGHQHHDHGHHDHGHHDHGHHGHAHGQHRLSWVGVGLGLALHTAIDGMALAASVVADAQHGDQASRLTLYGFGTFLAVALHKPLDALSITSLMAAGRWSKRWQLAMNAAFALMCPLGAVLFYFGVSGAGQAQEIIVGCALAFSAGVFVCISLGDLLPEISFHSHDRLKLSCLLVLGVVFAYLIGLTEPDHLHHH